MGDLNGLAEIAPRQGCAFLGCGLDSSLPRQPKSLCGKDLFSDLQGGFSYKNLLQFLTTASFVKAFLNLFLDCQQQTGADTAKRRNQFVPADSIPC